jgi:excinuclease UvrABC ATPase subunit
MTDTTGRELLERRISFDLEGSRCAFCEGDGTFIDTDGVTWPCPYTCGRERAAASIAEESKP